MAAGGEAPRFAIGPLTVPIDADVFAELVKRAKPGERVTYAEGPVALAGHPTFTRARAMRDAGLVELFQPRRGDNRGFDFLAVRLARAPDGAADAPKLPGDAEAMLALYSERAEAGQVCPTDGEAVTALGLINRRRAQYCRDVLATAGLIRVESRGPLMRRIVTIVATGKRTVEGAL